MGCRSRSIWRTYKCILRHRKKIKSRWQFLINEDKASYWRQKAQNVLRRKLSYRSNTNIAKNVILFLGDGMSIPTLAATRVYMGDENVELSFEKFPHTALSKTYCVDSQVADSACSATAYLGGVKGNIATIGVTATVELDDCDGMANTENHVSSILKWSQEAGKRTGIVTTSSVTDASPTATYGHTANRLWQDDTTILAAGVDVTKCRDIAYQLIKGNVGKQFNIILGGGSRVFMPNGTRDRLGSVGTRSDRVNLVKEWLKDKKSQGSDAEFIWNRDQLVNLSEDTEHVLGLFSDNYMPYNLDRNRTLTPSLTEMTEAAIKIARKGKGAKNGYFLFIEGGRIDQAHHQALAKKALEETAEFSRAITKAQELTNEKDTLIVVTADHAHTLAIAGYPERNNDIFGSPGNDEQGRTRLTLTYANGPGHKECGHDFSKDNTADKEFPFPGVYNLTSETHGGDDVAIFAKGPWSHLYSGVMEENVIPHIMAYASCVGKYTQRRRISSKQIKKFIAEAPNESSCGILGACRREELCQMSLNNIEDLRNTLVVNIPDSKTRVSRTFTVITGTYIDLYLNNNDDKGWPYFNKLINEYLHNPDTFNRSTPIQICKQIKCSGILCCIAHKYLLNLFNNIVIIIIPGEYDMHPDITPVGQRARTIDTLETTSNYWNTKAQSTLSEKVNSAPNTNIAKNVIMFLGDGMSIPTQTATRVYMGGEEQELSFEKLPYSALSKTYCVDKQTADSACTATAYLGGVKNNYGTLGVTAAVVRNDCDSMILEENHVTSIATWSQNAGKRTGIVTTSTITDASPAGIVYDILHSLSAENNPNYPFNDLLTSETTNRAYSHTANRNWQSDTDVTSTGRNVTVCRDIAHQLIKWDTGKNFNVILGGGSEKFLPTGTVDAVGAEGDRSDGRNLIEEWLEDRTAEGNTGEYVWNRTGLLGVGDDTDYVLGLFSSGNMPYNIDRDADTVPSLEEMTEIAIKIASKGTGAENGFFLFIEGGRIDHAHHSTKAKKSLNETVEFSKAVQKALDLTDADETLIVVTADHAHTMSVSGYADRNADILGSPGTDDNGGTRLTINYANGPGFQNSSYDYSQDDTTDDNYRFPSVNYLSSETHGADDVGIYANGPWAHLFSGVIEENLIPHIMAYASCVGDGLTACSDALEKMYFMKLNIFGVLFSPNGQGLDVEPWGTPNITSYQTRAFEIHTERFDSNVDGVEQFQIFASPCTNLANNNDNVDTLNIIPDD
ncbi:hypothetical protein NQ317_005660 [Molorchus minor]|uniref:Alkaline phosphatase n=1 Tax=Molorchus minor TaxID=1323400 RepID=A0ABQ9K829_9CUCU|nr:hypothetical protein NQ317_005660 [Molorchus minor]